MLWGQQVIVENKAGASGTLAADFVAQQPADGATLLLSNINSHALAPAVQPKLRYHAERDFTPIALLGLTPNLLIASSTNPAKTVKDVVALCKAQPGQVSFGSAGPGTIQHFAIEKFKLQAGVDALHVPYKGSGPAMTALISGEAAVMIPTLTLSLPHIRSQKVRALAVTSSARLDHMPALPTLAETLPGFEVLSWYGYVAPAGTPAAPISRLNSAIAKVLAMPDTRKGLAAVGMNTESSTPAEFGAFIKAELAKWGKVAREANLRL